MADEIPDVVEQAPAEPAEVIPDPPTSPPAEDEHEDNDYGPRVTALETRMDFLADTVANLIPPEIGGNDRDDTPKSKPWISKNPFSRK